MATLTQQQIDELKRRGLDDTKIRALAAKKGYDMPSGLSSLGNTLIKSEKGFGQSLAATRLANEGNKDINIANDLNRQVKTNLIQAIQEKRSKGEDTSRLINALKTLDKEVNFYDILNTSTGGSLDKSARQVVGEGLGVVADAAGLGVLPGGVGNIARATSFGKGVVQGAKAGAVGGAIFGGAQGATRAMQDNKSAGEIVGSSIRGGVAGAATGGALGGVLGGTAGAIRGRAQNMSTSKQDYLLDLVSENPTKKVREQAVAQGRVTEPGLLKASKILPSSRDYRLADAVDDVVSPKNTSLQNLDAIRSNVDKINSGVKQLISAKKTPFNTNQLLSRLNSGKDDLKLIFASDQTAERTYDAVVDEFIKHVQKKDTLGLFQARQDFDKIPAIKKLLESEALGENVRKQIVLSVRRAANEYIASLLPANNPYRSLLRQEHLMMEVIGNIAEKTQNIIGKNKLQLLTQKYPILKWLFGNPAATIASGAGVGVGATIIASTH